MMRYREIYHKAIDKWGEQAQFDQAIEECAELIVTLQHYARGKIGREVVLQELADVYLMVGQLQYIFGVDELNKAVEEKVTKLMLLMNE